MRKSLYAVILVLLGFVVGAQANLLTNPGFENSTNGWGAWTANNIQHIYNWGWQHSGTGMVQMWWDGGLYQDFAVVPGSSYVVSAWVCHPQWDPIIGGSTGVVAAVDLEWRDAGFNFISQPWQATFSSANLVPLEGNWTQAVSGVLTAPSGAAYGRLQLHIWNDGTGSGRVMFDDASAEGVIPEPLSAALLGVTGVILYAARRRSSR